MEEEENKFASIDPASNDDFDYSSIAITTISNGLYFNAEYMRTVYMVWNPKEDITTYELALCIPFIERRGNIYEYEIDNTKSFFRHFDIHYTA